MEDSVKHTAPEKVRKVRDAIQTYKRGADISIVKSGARLKAATTAPFKIAGAVRVVTNAKQVFVPEHKSIWERESYDPVKHADHNSMNRVVRL